jgi:peptide deformylase
MALRKILVLGEDTLRKKSRPVTAFDDKLAALLDDMAETLYDSGGAGLAAPQVGLLRRVVVIDVGEGLIELVNPRIVHAEGSKEWLEGCLSVPGKVGRTHRPSVVRVEAQDRRGKPIVMEGEDYLALAFCHEIDHLDGKLYVDIAEGPLMDAESEED